MHVVDSSGWIEFLTNQPNADYFEPPLGDTANLIVPTICLYEVFKRVLREFNQERALEAMGLMSEGKVVDLDSQIALDAARLSTELGLALADSVILATAVSYDAVLWTQDVHFKDIENVNFIAKKHPKKP